MDIVKLKRRIFKKFYMHSFNFMKSTFLIRYYFMYIDIYIIILLNLSIYYSQFLNVSKNRKGSTISDTFLGKIHDASLNRKFTNKITVHSFHC